MLVRYWFVMLVHDRMNVVRQHSMLLQDVGQTLGPCWDNIGKQLGEHRQPTNMVGVQHWPNIGYQCWHFFAKANITAMSVSNVVPT